MQHDELVDVITLLLRPLVVRITDLEADQKAQQQLRERVAVLEVRAPVPGPAGKDGANGIDGKDGAPGRDGTDGHSLDYAGVYDAGQTYQRGAVVTHNGSMWHCNHETTTKPDTNDGASAWTLMVKRGRDGRDLRDNIPAVRMVK